MKATFENTVNVLVKAYLNDTLEHGNYCSCAVGNLIADAVGAEIYERDPLMVSRLAWRHPEYSGGEWYHLSGSRMAKAQLESTGYSNSDIYKIENAFESCRNHSVARQDPFNGLMAVVDVLAEIHNVDLTVREESKKLFIKI